MPKFELLSQSAVHVECSLRVDRWIPVPCELWLTFKATPYIDFSRLFRIFLLQLLTTLSASFIFHEDILPFLSPWTEKLSSDINTPHPTTRAPLTCCSYSFSSLISPASWTQIKENPFEGLAANFHTQLYFGSIYSHTNPTSSLLAYFSGSVGVTCHTSDHWICDYPEEITNPILFWNWHRPSCCSHHCWIFGTLATSIRDWGPNPGGIFFSTWFHSLSSHTTREASPLEDDGYELVNFWRVSITNLISFVYRNINSELEVSIVWSMKYGRMLVGFMILPWME